MHAHRNRPLVIRPGYATWLSYNFGRKWHTSLPGSNVILALGARMKPAFLGRKSVQSNGRLSEFFCISDRAMVRAMFAEQRVRQCAVQRPFKLCHVMPRAKLGLRSSG